ncbi:hypothetical protein BUALT_Bualt02G0142400 [Buddleja alternifolia]|uniref:NB-ARC domain-containing protein n=1 Tax=Buddleja alternifolia TaxID=168488 RepID=A0AAV6YAY5_9LAMI|nr:hypothetical protein BUALT_Bualt02G0142400 [Buddleja alternifolia]
MSAYAALISPVHAMEHVQHYGRHLISLDEKQIESLREKIRFLQHFLQVYSHGGGSSKEVEKLESQIADTAFTAEDIIETHVVDQILSRPTNSLLFCDLGAVINDMDFINKKIKEEKGFKDQQSRHSIPSSSSNSTSSSKNTVVGFDDYLIQVMDELTGQQRSLAWAVLFIFPDNNNGSRIIVTTRLANVAKHLSSYCLEMDFLDDDKSWNLFCEKAFAQEGCPPKLEKIGRKITRKCKGLPLSIVVIGRLLAKSYKTQEYWENIAEDMNSILNSGDDEHCLKILSSSYSHLPAHLKPCFLYMGIFPEDHEIRVSRLIKLWVAEGFLKPKRSKSLEEVAEDYLKDLVDRNLILVCRWGSSGKIKTCEIHDILRDVCLRLGRKEKFLCVMRLLSPDVPQGISGERRIIIHENVPQMKYYLQFHHALYSASLARSLICNFERFGQLSFTSRLLRILSVIDRYRPEAVFHLVNLRYLALRPHRVFNYALPSSVSLLWNVQTLILRGYSYRIVLPSEIWEMPQLRHVEFDAIFLPDTSTDRQDDFVLGNLQTLLKVVDFRCKEEVLKRIPNIKKLQICYDDFSRRYKGESYYYLYNLNRLKKLESLNCFFHKLPNRIDLLQNFTFPCSLKKLTLERCGLHWEDLTYIGSLPYLEVLKLESKAVDNSNWIPVEGEFVSLKYLKICQCDLIYWSANNTHFPVLEKLVLIQLPIREIPLGIGEIPTLGSIHLEHCRESAVISAKKILDEQESYGNVGLQVRAIFWDKTELKSFSETMELESSAASDNFQVEAIW